MSDLALNYVPRKEHERIVAELQAEVATARAQAGTIATEDHDAIVETLTLDNAALRGEVDHLRALRSSLLSPRGIPAAGDIGGPYPSAEPTESEGPET